MSSSRCQDVSTVLRVVEDGRPWGRNNAEIALAMCVHMGARVPSLSHLKASRAGLLLLLKNLFTKVSV